MKRFLTLASSFASAVLALAVFFAYLFLVAQYESWLLPLSVMFSTGIAVVGALVGLLFVPVLYAAVTRR